MENVKKGTKIAFLNDRNKLKKTGYKVSRIENGKIYVKSKYHIEIPEDYIIGYKNEM